MALIDCHECSRQISTEAAACPHCGAAVKKPQQQLSFFKFILLAFVFLITFKACSESDKNKKPQTPPDPIAEARFQKTVLALNTLKSSLRDPSSFDLEAAMANDDASIICITYRAKNGFGGTNRENITISAKGASKEIKDWNRLCAGKTLYDLTFARHAIR